MSKFSLLAIFAVVLSLAPATAQTVTVNKNGLTVTASKDRVAKTTKDGIGVEATAEAWAYNITIKNSFNELDNLKVEYRIYIKDDFHGAKSSEAKLKRKEGSLQIEKLPKVGEYRFATDEVIIEKSELKSNYVYTDRAKPKIRDTVYGIWLRIYQNDQVIYEMLNPSTLKSEKW